MKCLINNCSKRELHQSKRRLFLLLNIGLITIYFIYFYLPYGQLRNNIFKEPWERSLSGDFQTCAAIVPIFLEGKPDEGRKSFQIFSWKTPNFADLLLRNKKSTSISNKKYLLNSLCSRFEHPSKPVEADLTAVTTGYTSMTSISHSAYVVMMNQNKLEVGQNITLQIQAKDSLGGFTATGSGDFFKIRAENPLTHSSVAATSVEDQGNGVYRATIQTFWSGRYDIKVFFGQSGHFVDVIKRFTSKFHGIESRFYGEFKVNSHQDKHYFGKAYDTIEKRKPLCHINPLTLNTNYGLCNFSAMPGEEWFCEKPDFPLRCSDLYSVYSKRRQTLLKLFGLFPIHDRGTLQRKTLQGTPSSIIVQTGKTGDVLQEDFPTCGPNLKTPHPSGYWLNGIWKSRVCKNFHYSLYTDKKAECLKNRTFFFIGDSTARQWYEYFIDPPDSNVLDKIKFQKHAFKAVEISSFSDVWEPRTAVIKELNAIFHYQSHGQPLQNGGLYSATTFVSQQLDSIPLLPDQGLHLTIVLALGPHFFLYNPDVYLNRIEATRDAALRLLSRNPKTTIIFKGTNTFIRGIGIGECCLSDWISYRQHLLAKHVFDGSPIIYLDVWDMTVSHGSEDLVHPVSEVITNEIDMALSFTCLGRI